jgi:hypothetical protein
MSLDTTLSRSNIVLLSEKIAGSGGNFFEFVNISHRRYKLRRDVEQTPYEAAQRYTPGPDNSPNLTYLPRAATEHEKFR